MSTPYTPTAFEDIEYPDSDGQPMSDNTLQFQWIVTIQGGLDALFRNDPNVFVAGDLLWYPVEGHPEIRTAPDALVAFGRPKGHRGSYMQWREDGIAPQVVWEVLSPGNRPGELEAKLAFYDQYGVEEYYQYDPDNGRLRGWLRQEDRLQEIAAIQGWTSPRLGVRLEMEGGELVVYRPDGQRFQTYLELERDKEERRRAQIAAEARAAAEQQRAEQERQRAEQERQQREAAQAQAEQERQQREAAQAEVEQERQRAEQERQQREAIQAQAEQERRQRESAQAEAEQERQQRAAAQARAEEERQRAERLAERLRALGIDPEE